MNSKLNLIKNSKGFVAIESIIAMSGVLFIILLFVSILCYNYPRIMLEKEIQPLAQTAKIQGGLTDETSQPANSDIDMFKDRLSKMGYDKSKIVVTAKTIPGNQNAIGVTPINSNGNNYIKRDSKQLIEVVVSVPADKGIFTAPLTFFGVKNTLNDRYVVREVVGSERW